MPMSAEECRAHAATCERMAESLGPDNYGLRETMREVADQWRRLAKDAEARSANRPCPRCVCYIIAHYRGQTCPGMDIRLLPPPEKTG